MKIIRHILSHLILIAVLIGIGAVYFYRHQVLPDKYVEQIDHYAEMIHPKLVTIAAHKDSKQEVAQPELIQTSQNIDVIYVDDVPLVEDTNNQEVSESQQSESVEVTDSKPEEKDTQAEEIVKITPEQNQVTEVVTAEQKEIEKSAETVEQQADIDNQQTVSNDKAAADFIAVLRDARTAFGKGDMELAVKKYNELIELENDEADFHGELGNVYYAMGKWDLAGASYYEAATRLIEAGQLAQVGYLQRVIQGLDAERAGKLAKQLANAGQ